MATYAIVNENNEVLNLIKLADDMCEDENGNEVPEKVRAAELDILGPGATQRFIKTSINNNGKGTCARPGDVWDEDLEMFIEPKPANRDEYVLSADGTWDPPESTKPTLTDFQSENGFSYYYSQPTHQWILKYDREDETKPTLTAEEEAAGKVYVWDMDDYVEGDISSGYTLVTAPVEETSEEDPVEETE